MAEPKQFPHAYYIRLSDEGKAGLDRQAKIMGLQPAVAGRVIIEHSVKGEPIKLPLKGGKMFGLSKKKDDRVVSPEERSAHQAKASSAARQATMVVYHAKDGWRWRLTAPNGKVTADSGEAYIRRFDAKIAAMRLTEVAAGCKIVVNNR